MLIMFYNLYNLYDQCENIQVCSFLFLSGLVSVLKAFDNIFQESLHGNIFACEVNDSSEIEANSTDNLFF